jgi:hypothetical protein
MLMVLGHLAIIFKIIFIILAVFYRISQKKSNPGMSKFLLVWKERTDVLYVTAMSIFLIYIFSPWTNNRQYLTRSIYHLLFLYGIISIITANWASFK